MGHGFLGTRATLMLDVVLCSLVLVVPTLLVSIYWVRSMRRYQQHRTIQLVLTGVLAVVVALFEIDMKRQGGFWEIARGSAYYDTSFLRNLLTVHLCFSISTAVLWPLTALSAWWFFPYPVRPNPFSGKHKVMAWITVVDMVATVVTGVMVYYYGFVK